jgi:NADH-quinone oxidoreductase subunit C
VSDGEQGDGSRGENAADDGTSTAAEVLGLLQGAGQGEGLELFPGPGDPAVVVPRERLLEVCRRLKSAPELRFEQCVLVTGTHMLESRDKKSGEVLRPAGFEVMIHLRSLRHHRELALKIRLPFDDPRLDSVSEVWPAANWHERETYDLVGVVFDGHPNLIRILLPEDWEGHPLRKDYLFPKEHRGISLEVDPPWPQP